MSGSVVAGYFVPGMPQVLLAPEQNPGWSTLREAYGQVRQAILAHEPDVLMLYSTQWPSVIGHQIQSNPQPKWTHVDYEWHELGAIEYDLRMDQEFAEVYLSCAHGRGLHARTINYEGFPVDTGTVVALQLLTPNNEIPACVVSCNMYADRGETLVLGKAMADAARKAGKRVVAIAVTNLSSRLHTERIAPADDRVSSLKDDEWNQKILQFLSEGRLEDVSQLARQFYREANADQKFKAAWWLAAALGQHNNYEGKVFGYEPVMGAGCALVELVPSEDAAANQEFDEDDVEYYGGDRDVLDAGGKQPENEQAGGQPPRAARPSVAGESPQVSDRVDVEAAPRPVGAYPHARRVGDMLYLSGIGPRDPKTDEVVGGAIHDAKGNPQEYDAAAQTESVIQNIKTILEASGASLRDVVDVTVFLVDMDRDFAAFNKVYAKHFAEIGPTRTTVAVRAMPTPIAVELKVVARLEK